MIYRPHQGQWQRFCLCGSRSRSKASTQAQRHFWITGRDLGIPRSLTSLSLLVIMDAYTLHQEQKLSNSPSNAKIIKQQPYYSNSLTQTHHKYHINGYLIQTRALPHPQHVREALPCSYTRESLQPLVSCSLGCLSPAFIIPAPWGIPDSVVPP